MRLNQLRLLLLCWMLFWGLLWAFIRLTRPMDYWDSPWYEWALWLASAGAVALEVCDWRSGRYRRDRLDDWFIVFPWWVCVIARVAVLVLALHFLMPWIQTVQQVSRPDG